MPMANAMAPINSVSITHLTEAGKAPLLRYGAVHNGVQAPFRAANSLTLSLFLCWQLTFERLVPLTPDDAMDGGLEQAPRPP
jgi:hypothetical protein